MATWVRNGTGTAPTSTNADLAGTYELDNGTAPGDFDPAAVNSVRFEYRIQGVGTGDDDDTWDDLRLADLTLDGDGTQLANIDGNNNSNIGPNSPPVNSDTDETDSSPNNGQSVADWEGAELNVGAAVTRYAVYNQEMMADGLTLTMSLLVITIDYEPSSGAIVDGDGIGHGVSTALTAHDLLITSDGIGHASPSTLTTHNVIIAGSGVGRAVASSQAVGNSEVVSTGLLVHFATMV